MPLSVLIAVKGILLGQLIPSYRLTWTDLDCSNGHDEHEAVLLKNQSCFVAALETLVYWRQPMTSDFLSLPIFILFASPIWSEDKSGE